VIDEDKIVVHAEPVERDRTNYIVRWDLAFDELPGWFEQLWTRTDDRQRYELCCIPFFPYGVSLGDIVEFPDGAAPRVVAKSGHRTVRLIVEDVAFAHERHHELHGAIAATGAAMEFCRFRGHERGYGAVDLADDAQVDAVLAVFGAFHERSVISWEWADPKDG